MSKSARFNSAHSFISPPGIDFAGEVSLTKQADMDSCDINLIMDRFTKTGVFPAGQGSPIFGDFTDGNDFQDKLNLVVDANNAFMNLDARIRSRFSNDPAQLIHFLSDDANRDEAIKLGLIDQKLDIKGDKISPPASPDTAKTTE